MTDRRQFLLGTALFCTTAAMGPMARAAAADTVLIEKFDATGKSLGTVRMAKLVRSDAQWQAQLSPQAYEITRHAGTERAFTGALWNNHASGLYRCACCDTALFDSRTKFNSHTGWPSFYAPISTRNVTRSRDTSLFMQRIAISCTECDAHLGHVFNDGPGPTGLRYCMNSASLKFVPRDAHV